MEFLLLLPNTIVAGLVSLLVFAFYYTFRKSKLRKGQKAPVASGAWPIIGHLPLLSGPELPHITLEKLADKHGPIFTIQLGVYQFLVISSREIVKEIFTTNDLIVSDRPRFTAPRYLSYNLTMLPFSPYGDYWREVRRITNLELLSNRQVELLKDVRKSEVEGSIMRLYKIWNEEKDGLGHALVEFRNWFGTLTLSAIVRIVAGKRYYGTGVVSEKEEARRCVKELREFFRLLGMLVVRDAFPFLGWLDIGGHEKAMKRNAEELDSILGAWLEEHRRKKDSGVDKEQDFMDVMLGVFGDRDFGAYDSDTVIKSTCLALIAGGTDTIAVTLTWALSLLLNNEHVLKKAQEELDTCIGKERMVNESDISKLTYLQAIVKETLRLHPPTPLSIPREAAKDLNIGGFHVKKGTRLIINVRKIQRDGRVWDRPLEFKPERFLTSHKDVDIRGPDFELIPFGSGRRICPGASFAFHVLHSALASLLHAFDLSNPSKEPIDMTGSIGLTNQKATPLEVLVAPRLPPQLYAR